MSRQIQHSPAPGFSAPWSSDLISFGASLTCTCPHEGPSPASPPSPPPSDLCDALCAAAGECASRAESGAPPFPPRPPPPAASRWGVGGGAFHGGRALGSCLSRSAFRRSAPCIMSSAFVSAVRVHTHTQPYTYTFTRTTDSARARAHVHTDSGAHARRSSRTCMS